MQDSPEIKMYGVLASHIDEVWSEVEPYLQRAIDRSADGKYQVEDIYNSLLSQDMQLWIAYDDQGLCAIEVTQILMFPRKKVLMLMFTAGRQVSNWLHLTNNLMLFAKANGCASIEGYCRPGWEKLLTPLGFKKIHTIFKYEL